MRVPKLASVARLVSRIRRKLLQEVVRRALVRRGADDLVRLGSRYGGWWVPVDVLAPGTTVISAGVGEDTTFDEELIARGCEVWAVDPTPRAEQHVAARIRDGALIERFHFWPVGLWHRDETLRFYAPADPSHVSHSILNVQHTNAWFEAECWSVARLLEQAGIEVPDLVKLDIEGAEVEVLRTIIERPARPRALCVELDAPLPEWRTASLLRDLRRAGYRLAHAEGWNLLLLNDPARGVGGA
jgi:FkbM family methyltransferase